VARLAAEQQAATTSLRCPQKACLLYLYRMSVHPPMCSVAPPAATRLAGMVVLTGLPGIAYMPRHCQKLPTTLPLICTYHVWQRWCAGDA
jgi:hypothetical protein